MPTNFFLYIKINYQMQTTSKAMPKKLLPTVNLQNGIKFGALRILRNFLEKKFSITRF